MKSFFILIFFSSLIAQEADSVKTDSTTSIDSTLFPEVIIEKNSQFN